MKPPKEFIMPKKSIDNVTITNLDLSLRMVGIDLTEDIIDHIIDLVELLEEKGDNVTIKDICELQSEWGKTKDKL